MSRRFSGSTLASRSSNGNGHAASATPATHAAPARSTSALTPQQEILGRVARGELTPEEEATRLLDQAKPIATGGLSIRVSPKRAVSIYGLQRMPVTLYPKQWLRLIAIVKDVEQFVEQHGNELSWGKEQSVQ